LKEVFGQAVTSRTYLAARAILFDLIDLVGKKAIAIITAGSLVWALRPDAFATLEVLSIEIRCQGSTSCTYFTARSVSSGQIDGVTEKAVAKVLAWCLIWARRSNAQSRPQERERQNETCCSRRKQFDVK
jgi:hypothetical protein